MNVETKTKFADYNLRKELVIALEKKGFDTPLPVQVRVLEDETLIDNDIIVQARTGSGKTLAFALPLINIMDTSKREPQIVVLSPTRELSLQIAREFTWVGVGSGVRVATLVGGMDMGRQIRSLNEGANVVIATPGRLLDHIRRGTFKGGTVTSVVLDEGDNMLDMGFREELEGILEAMPQAERTWLFSATMPREVVNLAKRYLDAPIKITLVSDVTTHEDITQKAYIIPSRKRFEGLTNVLIWENPSKSLLFCGTRVETQTIADRLCDIGFRATPIHGDMSQRERNTALSALRGGRVDILVATDVAARGLDIDAVSHVFQYGIPQNIESFVHRSGRTGRAGHEGSNMLLLTAREARQFKYMERSANSKLKLEWLPAPDAEEIEGQSRVRFEEEILEYGIESEEFQAWSNELLKRDDASLIFTGLLAKAYGDQPSGYSIRSDVEYEMDREKRSDGGRDNGRRQGRSTAAPVRDRDSKERFQRRKMTGGIAVNFSVGRSDGWEVGPLLGFLCRNIGIGREDVGNIRLRDTSVTVELSAKAASLFDARKDRLVREGLTPSSVRTITEQSDGGRRSSSGEGRVFNRDRRSDGNRDGDRKRRRFK